MASISSSGTNSSATGSAARPAYANPSLTGPNTRGAYSSPRGTHYYNDGLRQPGTTSFGINQGTSVTERQKASGVHGQILYVDKMEGYGYPQFKNYKDVTSVDLDERERMLPGLTHPNDALAGIKGLEFEYTMASPAALMPDLYKTGTLKLPHTDSRGTRFAKDISKPDGDFWKHTAVGAAIAGPIGAAVGTAIAGPIGAAVGALSGAIKTLSGGRGYDYEHAQQVANKHGASGTMFASSGGNTAWLPGLDKDGSGTALMNIGQSAADKFVSAFNKNILQNIAAEGAVQLSIDAIKNGLHTVQTNYNLTQDQIMRNLVRIPQAAQSALKLGEEATNNIQAITNREYFTALEAYDPYWYDLVNSSDATDENTQLMIESFQKGNASAHAYAGALAESKLVADAKKLLEGNYPESVKQSIVRNSFAAKALLGGRANNRGTVTARDLGQTSDTLKTAVPNAITNAMQFGATAVELSNNLSATSQASAASLYGRIAGFTPEVIDVQSVFGNIYGGMLGANVTTAPTTFSLASNAGAIGANIVGTASTQMQNFANSWATNMANMQAQDRALYLAKKEAKKQRTSGIVTGVLGLAGMGIGAAVGGAEGAALGSAFGNAVGSVGTAATY